MLLLLKLLMHDKDHPVSKREESKITYPNFRCLQFKPPQCTHGLVLDKVVSTDRVFGVFDVVRYLG